MTNYDFKSIFIMLIFLVEGLSPVLGLSLIALELNIKKWILKSIKITLPLMGIAYFILGLNQLLHADKVQILLYSVAISLFLHYLQKRNPDKNAQVLGIVLIVTHIFTQYWEIPLFILAHLGHPAFGYHGSIDQVYLLLVFYLGLRFTKKTIEMKDLILLLIPLIVTTLVFYSNPIAFTYVTPAYFLVRCISCICIGKFFLDRRLP